MVGASKRQVTLAITTSGIAITASDCNVRLQWKEVLSLQSITNFFEKGLALTTPQGKI